MIEVAYFFGALLTAGLLVYFVVLPLARWVIHRTAPYDNPLFVKRSEMKPGHRIKVNGSPSRFTRIEIIEDEKRP